MRVLVLTSNQSRHLYLVQRLVAAGYKVQAWAEEKGDSLNQCKFDPKMEILGDLHAQALKDAMEYLLPKVEPESVPLKFFSRGSFKGEAVVPEAKTFEPDFVLVYGSGIVGKPLLELFEGRVIGSHQGLPQYYRGSASNFFAFAEGKAAWMGVSMHLLDAGIDTGPVFKQHAPVPKRDDTYYSFSAKLVEDTINLYLEVLNDFQLKSPVDLSEPLNNIGKLFKRKDFLPDVLRKMMLMQFQNSFYGWYQESLKTYGPPELIGHQ